MLRIRKRHIWASRQPRATPPPCRLDDFTIPKKELESSYLHSYNHGLSEYDVFDTTVVDEMTIHLQVGPACHRTATMSAVS